MSDTNEGLNQNPNADANLNPNTNSNANAGTISAILQAATVNGTIGASHVVVNDYTIAITDITGGHRITVTKGSEVQTLDVMDGITPAVPVQSVNGKTGAVVLAASDVNALPDSTVIPGSLSDLSTDTAHRTVTDAEKASWTAKQDAISDIATIRSGAALGATALQSVPDTYRTAAQQDAIHDSTKVNVSRGIAHAGEFVVVGSDGDITTVTMTAWQGGSY